MNHAPYYVIVCDLFHSHEPDHESVVSGFCDRERAIEYAQRRTWSSVEEMRRPDSSPEEILGRWRGFGEDCRVVGPEGLVYVASSEMERFLASSPPPEAQAWADFPSNDGIAVQ